MQVLSNDAKGIKVGELIEAARGEPVTVMQNGEAVAAVLSPTEFDRLDAQDRISTHGTRLARTKFAKYLAKTRRRVFVAELALAAIHVELSGFVSFCRDPDEDKLLEIAAVGRGDCLGTGDQDLLSLHPFQGVPILTPAGFLAAVGAG
jgi:putative PIN family toxin of toxin-antitoxin system